MKDEKSQRLLNTLDRIDDAILEEAGNIDSADKLKRAKASSLMSTRGRGLASVAACLIIILATVLTMPDVHNSPSADECPSPADSPANSVMNIITTPADNAPEASDVPASTDEGSNQIVTSRVEECIPELYPGNSTDTSGEAPYTLRFSSSSDIRAFLSAAKAQNTVYDDYSKGNSSSAALPQSIAGNIADKMTAASGHVCLRAGYSFDDYSAEYRISSSSGADSFELCVTVDGTKYSFYHWYDAGSASISNKGSYVGRFSIGDSTVDLYLSDGCLYGSFKYNEMLITVRVDSDTPSDGIFGAFEIVKFVQSRS